MGRGRRFDSEPKLNMTKVIGVIVAVAIIIMFISVVKGLFTKDDSAGKVTSNSYFAVYKDEKWGVIDNSGKYVVDPAYKEMIVVPNNKQGIFICIYDVDYTTGTYKTKALNEKNKEIFTDYDQVEALQNKDNKNNVWYEQEVLKVQKNGKYGLINISGKEVVPTEYEEITIIEEIANSFKALKNGKYGIIDGEGKTVIEPKYANIDVLGKDNKSGFVIENDEGKYGIINYSGEEILSAKYDEIEKIYGQDLYVVSIAGQEKVVNKEGNDVITSGFDSIKKITSDGIIFTRSNKYGLMSLLGEVIIPATYDDLKPAKLGSLIAKKDLTYGIIDTKNEEQIPFDYMSIIYDEKADIYISEDINYTSNILNSSLETKLKGIFVELNMEKGFIKMRIDEDYKYYNFKFEEKKESEIYTTRTLFLSKQNGKYGYIDKDGNVVVDYIYDDAREQNECGFAAVKKDGKWGSVNKQGKISKEPTYELEDYLVIDFIGGWHLGLDLNMNYYNQL